MDKVDFSQGIETTLNNGNLSPSILGGTRTSTRRTRATGSKRKEFSNALERSILDLGELGPLTTIAPSEEAVHELLDAVHSAGNDLKHRPFPEEILSYKKAVRDFLHYVVENSFELEQSQTAMRKRKELKPYMQIRVIDQKLEELAAGILTRQINQLDLKNRLEEITGLLIDLTVTGKISQDE
ncbi:MAG: YaaR family protein [Treponema sp.]|jgi:uncharacterized protein YaaR (DUF327 family)|nr:YaaR family protein [Treponema sp.]